VTFEAFFREHYGEVVRSMRLLVGDDARAEELTQEAFARAYRHWRRVQRLDRPVAWVYVVATNAARREWRRTRSRETTLASGAGPAEADASATVVTTLDVRAALAQLTERQRAAVVLRYAADLPIAEIAEIMDVAPGTVKATLHQALARLRVELTDDEVEPA